MTTLTIDDFPLKLEAFEGDEFVELDAVPIFKEHMSRDGIPYDRAAMVRIAERCNERIRDTGDYAPVCIGHTDDEGKKKPKVVGFAGPFKVGMLGRVRPRAAIFAKMRIFKGDIADVRRFPRVSVEFWSSKHDPTDGYFDPISLLGPETPELDLGVIRFSRRGGRRVVRYSAAMRFQASAPGGSNTSIPGGVGRRDKPQQHERGGPMLGDDDLKRILDGLKAMVVEMIDDRFAAMNKADPANVGIESPADEPAGATQYAKDFDDFFRERRRDAKRHKVYQKEGGKADLTTLSRYHRERSAALSSGGHHREIAAVLARLECEKDMAEGKWRKRPSYVEHYDRFFKELSAK